jgi:hypothetical protein
MLPGVADPGRSFPHTRKSSMLGGAARPRRTRAMRWRRLAPFCISWRAKASPNGPEPGPSGQRSDTKATLNEPEMRSDGWRGRRTRAAKQAGTRCDMDWGRNEPEMRQATGRGRSGHERHPRTGNADPPPRLASSWRAPPAERLTYSTGRSRVAAGRRWSSSRPRSVRGKCATRAAWSSSWSALHCAIRTCKSIASRNDHATWAVRCLLDANVISECTACCGF